MLPTQNNTHIDSQEFYFISNYPTKMYDTNYMFAFRGKFKIKSFFDIQNINFYAFFPNDFCSSCLYNGHIKGISGNIAQIQTNGKNFSYNFLTNIYMEITDTLIIKQKVEQISENNRFILVNSIDNYNNNYEKGIFIRKMGKNMFNEFFEIIRAYIINPTSNSFEFLPNTTFIVNGGEKPLNKKNDYTIYEENGQGILYKFDMLERIVCSSYNKDLTYCEKQ